MITYIYYIYTLHIYILYIIYIHIYIHIYIYIYIYIYKEISILIGGLSVNISCFFYDILKIVLNIRIYDSSGNSNFSFHVSLVYCFRITFFIFSHV